MTDTSPIRINVDGRDIVTSPDVSIIEAVWQAGETLVAGVGCLQGVCGSCRIMVRRAGSSDVTMELACETIVEPAMQVTFVGFLAHHRHHAYQIEDFYNAWDVLEQVNDTFPEAAHCRHCGGCDATCPRGLEVQRGVNLLIVGSVQEASDIFADCVMCNLCTRACPEHIGPNHLGMLGRRIVASHGLHSPNLLLRLDQIRRGALTVDVDAIEVPAARGDN